MTTREAVARLVSFIRKDQRDREFDQELAAHIEMATTEHMRQGLDAHEARRRAIARLGGIEPVKQLHRETRGMPLLDGLLQDVRYSLRTLRRSPAFTVASVATLAIGIGATTAIFSTVNATLLRPLPYPNSDQLVDVHTRNIDGRITSGNAGPPEIAMLRTLPGVAEAGGVNSSVVDGTWVADDSTVTAVAIRPVTARFFQVLGTPMALGRAFTDEEHTPGPGARTSAMVISHRFWMQRLSSNPAIIGKSLRLGEFSAPLIVIGVAAPGFDFPSGTDFWVNARVNDLDGSHNYNAVVRLRPGTTMAQLLSAGNLAMAELGKTIPQEVGREFVLQPLLSSLVGDLRPVLLIVLGATVLLLLLACVNVTNLCLAKGATQRHEIAMRTALGAGRGRVIRQLVTQSMVLSTAGTVVGLAVGYGAVRLLLLGASGLPRLDSVPFDWRVVMFSLVVLIVCGIAIGVLPALRLSDTDLKTVLNDHGRRTTSSPATSRVMSGMIVAEVAVAIALVAGAGWLIQSFARLHSTDPGFASDGRLVIDVRPTHLFASPADAMAWSTEMLNRVRGAAGNAAAVGAAATFPMQAERDNTSYLDFLVETPDPTRMPVSRIRIVTSGFFEAMGTKVIAGRTFTEDDRTTTQRVAVVNRAFAQKFLHDANPVGSAFAYGFPVTDRAHPLVIAGVIDDIRYKAVSEEAEPAFYLPQSPLRRQWVVVSRPGSPEVLISQIRNALKEFDPSVALDFTTSKAMIDKALKRQQLGMTLMLVFGATALALAAIGLYGVIAYAAAQRRGELATRIALGASGRQVFWLMMSGGQRLTAIGVVVGLFLAYAAGRAVSGSVFAMRAADPVVLLTACALVALVAWIATMVPAIRASRQDPVRALRD